MASRLLSNALQARSGISKQLVRPLATSAQQATRTTVLSNGFTIATEENPSLGSATVGVWIDAGSRNDTTSTSGIANLAQSVSLKGGKAIEKFGGDLIARTTRDQTYYAAKTLRANVSSAVEILADLVQDVNINAAAVDAQRGAVLKQQAAAANNLEDVVFDHLHATAFQGETLGLTVAGLKETVEALTAEDVNNFKKTNYTAQRAVLVGAGDVDHDALVRVAEKAFGGLSGSAAPAAKKAAFTGSEIRLRDDVLPRAHIALAVEGAPLYTPEYFHLLVMQAVIGSWDSSLGGAANLTSRLSTIVNNNHLADSFASFTKGYKDTGLWGLYAVTQNRDQIDDLVHFLQKEWARLSTSVTASEVELAKQQVKASLLLSLDSSAAVAQDIGAQVLATGKRLSAEEWSQAINKISVSDIRNTAYKLLWDQEVAVVGAGPIECLTDYTRVRGLMAYNRF